MRMAVLGATGAVGSLLVRTALDRGHEVTALARDPERVSDLPGLIRVAAEVNDPASVARAVEDSDVLVSGLGGPPGTLTAGATAAVESGVKRIVWLSAYGTGRSASRAGLLTRTLLSVAMRAELPDKVAADETVVTAGGTVVHVGLMGDGPADHRIVPLTEAPRRLLPPRISRTAVAAAMLDEAERPRFPGQVVLAIYCHPPVRLANLIKRWRS